MGGGGSTTNPTIPPELSGLYSNTARLLGGMQNYMMGQGVPDPNGVNFDPYAHLRPGGGQGGGGNGGGGGGGYQPRPPRQRIGGVVTPPGGGDPPPGGDGTMNPGPVRRPRRRGVDYPPEPELPPPGGGDPPVVPPGGGGEVLPPVPPEPMIPGKPRVIKPPVGSQNTGSGQINPNGTPKSQGGMTSGNMPASAYMQNADAEQPWRRGFSGDPEDWDNNDPDYYERGGGGGTPRDRDFAHFDPTADDNYTPGQFNPTQAILGWNPQYVPGRDADEQLYRDLLPGMMNQPTGEANAVDYADYMVGEAGQVANNPYEGTLKGILQGNRGANQYERNALGKRQWYENQFDDPTSSFADVRNDPRIAEMMGNMFGGNGNPSALGNLASAGWLNQQMGQGAMGQAVNAAGQKIGMSGDQMSQFEQERQAYMGQTGAEGQAMDVINQMGQAGNVPTSDQYGDLYGKMGKFGGNTYQDTQAEKLMGQAQDAGGQYATNQYGAGLTNKNGLVDQMLNRGFSREEQALQFAKQQMDVSKQAPELDLKNNARINAALEAFNLTTAPEIENQMNLAGLGRSSAKADALAKAQAQMMLPLIQEEIGLQERGIGRQMEGANSAANTYLQAAQQGVNRAATGGSLGLQASEANTQRQQAALGQKYQALQDEIKNRRDLSESQKARELQSIQSQWDMESSNLTREENALNRGQDARNSQLGGLLNISGAQSGRAGEGMDWMRGLQESEFGRQGQGADRLIAALQGQAGNFNQGAGMDMSRAGSFYDALNQQMQNQQGIAEGNRQFQYGVSGDLANLQERMGSTVSGREDQAFQNMFGMGEANRGAATDALSRLMGARQTQIGTNMQSGQNEYGRTQDFMSGLQGYGAGNREIAQQGSDAAKNELDWFRQAGIGSLMGPLGGANSMIGSKTSGGGLFK